VKTYFDCWIDVATALFAQAVAGEPELTESLPRPMASGSFGFAATLSGDVRGHFSVILDAALLELPLMGEGVDQRAGWAELLREVADAASGELLARSGSKCRVENFEQIAAETKVTRAFQLKCGERNFALLVRDEVRPAAEPVQPPAQPGRGSTGPAGSSPAAAPQPASPILTPGVELLLDVELEASLRFGCREMPLGQLLDLGPGDVVQLDRHVADPVDLIVGDKIVARGEVVLVNGNFGLRVTEVARWPHPESGWRAYDAFSDQQGCCCRLRGRNRGPREPAKPRAHACRQNGGCGVSCSARIASRPF
jgi:flagellar motor switch protein FliN